MNSSCHPFETVALAVAMRHPELVRKLAIYGSCAGSPKDTYDHETYKQYQSIPARLVTLLERVLGGEGWRFNS